MLRTSPIINNPSTAGQMVQISCWASPVAQEPKTTLISRTVVQGGSGERYVKCGGGGGGGGERGEKVRWRGEEKRGEERGGEGKGRRTR